MHRILYYAQRQNFTLYTSTLPEAWRASIEGLNKSFEMYSQLHDDIPELDPDNDYSSDPVTDYGMSQARKHRDRGVSISMFIGLMKYYRKTYQDLLQEVASGGGFENNALYVDRFFDRIEIGFCSEWAAASEDQKLIELQSCNRVMTNEKNRYLTIFESMDTPAILISPDGTLVNINHRALALFASGGEAGAVYYNSEVLIPIKLDWLTPLIEKKRLITEDKVRVNLDTNEGLRDYTVHIQEMLDVSNKFSGTVITLHDITEILRVQEERAKLTNSLVKSNNELKRLITELNEKNAELDSFAHTISHDLKSPLQGISGYAELLQLSLPDDTPEDVKSYVSEIIHSAMNMGQLINHILEISYIDQAENPQHVVSLATVVEDILRTMRPKLEEGSVEIVLTEPLPSVSGDSFRIAQLIQNLLENSCKYVGEQRQPKIEIGVAEAPSGVRALYVKDNGEGIAPGFHDQIFSLFSRINTEPEGTGIGLTLVKKIARQHGGDVWVDSEGSGKGTVIWVALPFID